jgi:plastocyanin domain-containing protein
MRTATIVVAAVLAVACGHKDEAAAAPPKVERTKAADGSTEVAIKVSDQGYQPASFTAEAGEKLTLVFTRTMDVECGQFVKVPGVPGQTELPVGKPVPIKLTMPAKGELVFTCGMDMMRGVIKVVAR